MTLIDVHTHALPPLREPSQAERAGGWPEVRDADGVRRVSRGGKLVRELGPAAWDVTARVTAMDRDGVAQQVVSPAPFAFLYDAEPTLAAEFAAHLNDSIAGLCAQEPDRLLGFGSVPLQDPAVAVAELQHVVGLGLTGVEIGSNAVTRQLHDPELEEFFAEAERLGVPLFLHPGPLDMLDRTGHNGLAFALARPVETELAIGSLAHGGVLERHPALRVCVAHGGAGVPALAGRWQAGWERRTPGVRPGSAAPRLLLARLWSDTLTYDPSTLASVASTFGLEHLVLGTDFPFTAQESPPGAAMAEAGLVPHWQDELAANARAFLFGADTDAGAAQSPTGSPRTQGGGCETG